MPQGERAFRILAGRLQGALRPDGSNGRLALFHESKTEKRTTLNGVAEGTAAIAGFGNFLEFADSLLEEPHFAKRDAQVVVCFEIFILRAHLTELGAKLVKNFLERDGLGRRRRWCGRLRSGRRRNIRCVSRKSRRQSTNAELIDFVGQIGQELIGSKTTTCGLRRSGVLRDWLRLARGNGFFRWLLIMCRHERFRVEYELVLLVQFEFGLAALGRFLRKFGLGWRRCLWGILGDGYRLKWNCRSGGSFLPWEQGGLSPLLQSFAMCQVPAAPEVPACSGVS